MKQTQAISHATKPQEKALYQTVTSLNCTSRSLLPLILRFQGLREHSYSNRYPGGPQWPPTQTLLRLGATQAPYR